MENSNLEMKVTEKMDPTWTLYDTALAIFSLRSIQSYMDFIQYCTSNQLKINTITRSPQLLKYHYAVYAGDHFFYGLISCEFQKE